MLFSCGTKGTSLDKPELQAPCSQNGSGELEAAFPLRFRDAGVSHTELNWALRVVTGAFWKADGLEPVSFSTWWALLSACLLESMHPRPGLCPCGPLCEGSDSCLRLRTAGWKQRAGCDVCVLPTLGIVTRPQRLEYPLFVQV